MTEFKRLSIDGLVEIRPPRFEDSRGYFSETWKKEALEAEGLFVEWVQENHSYSAAPGTIRGLHYQRPPFAQDKLIRVLRGAIFDVALDIRSGSPAFGQWAALELSAERWNQLFIPAGFAHGFMTIAPDTEVMYKVSAPWSPEHEDAILWNDPDLAITWPAFKEPVVSEKDRSARPFADHRPGF